jgi:hypothetical protein
VYIADYNMKFMKKYCKNFLGYDNLTQYSATELWQQKYPTRSNKGDRASLDPYENPEVDVYSFGILLHEIETCKIPFADCYENHRELRNKLLKDKLRPSIPKGTNRALTDLIRNCWHNDPLCRPSFEKIVKEYLPKVKFS